MNNQYVFKNKILENIASFLCPKCVLSLETILFSLEAIMSSPVSKIDRSLSTAQQLPFFECLIMRTPAIPEGHKPQGNIADQECDVCRDVLTTPKPHVRFHLITRNSPWPFHKLGCLENDIRSRKILIYKERCQIFGLK